MATSLFALFGIAALSLDTSHLFLNKTRLQNAVDAAALSAAKTLDMTDDRNAATAAAAANFKGNIGGPGNQELLDNFSGQDPTVQFSASANPFVPGSGDGPYVRVAVGGFDADTWFAGVFGMDKMTASASAVAGPTPTMDEVCNLLPVIVCGESDGDDVFGYEPGEQVTLKTGAEGNGRKGGDKFDIGAGNFHLLRADGNSGGSDIRDAMAGIGNNCIRAGDPLETEPGNKVGPAVQGLNTRFDSCKLGGGACVEHDIRPDMVTREDIDYEEYAKAYESGMFQNSVPLGEPERRIAVAPIGRCTGNANGQSQVEFLGFGCFFLTHKMVHKGKEATLSAELLGKCEAGEGPPNTVQNSGPGPYKIVLYKDTLSSDS